MKLAAAEPSAEAWRTLCERLSKLKRAEVSSDLLGDLDAQMGDRWPDSLRATMCGMKWDEDMLAGRHDPRHLLVRTLRYDKYFSGRYTGLMIRSPDHVAGSIARSKAPQHWTQLRSIRLSHQNLSDADVRAIAKAPLPHLRHLALTDISVAALEAICQAPWAKQLEDLSFNIKGDGDAAFMALAEAPFERLNKLYVGDTKPRETGAERFAQSKQMPALTSLSFGSVPLSASVLRALSTGLHALRELSLYKCNVNAQRLHALLEDTHLSLCELRLDINPLGDEGARVLAAFGDGIESLSMDRVGMTDNGMEALASSPKLRRLKSLKMCKGWGETRENKLTGRGLTALLDSAYLSHLSELELEGSFESIDGGLLGGLEALVLRGAGAGIDFGRLGRALGSGLRRLELSDCGMDAAGADALFERLIVEELETVKLSKNRLGAVAFGRLQHAPKLNALHLDHCGLGADDIAPLLESHARPERVYLDHNPLGDEGVMRLAASPFISETLHLGLNETGVTCRGAVALAHSPHMERAERVFLENNQIGDEGALELAKRVKRGGGWMNVTLYNNDYGAEAEAVLKKTPPRCCP